MTKYDHLGAMAQNGLQAALLAQRGFTGDLEVLEGEDIGFWRFAGGQGCDWDHLVNGLGTQWTMREVSYKPYPVGLYTGPSIDVVRKIAQENQLRPEEIEHIEVRTTRVGDTPERMQLRHSLDAWLSTPYTITAGLFDVRPRRSWQEPKNYQRKDLLEFMPKISFAKIRDGELTSTGNYWERWSPARVTITARGQSFEGGMDMLPMLDDDALTAKFHENLDGLMDPADGQQLAQRIWDLPKDGSTRQLTEVLTRVKRPR
jgi:2-methylcitrate dehydratase PrpD